MLFCLSYSGLGILDLLKRNSKIKPAPEKFQELTDFDFTIIFTFETTVFDQVLQGMILFYFFYYSAQYFKLKAISITDPVIL